MVRFDNTCFLMNNSLGTNSSMFANCSSFGDVREVQSSVLGLKVMFGEVRSSVLMFGVHYEHFGVMKYPIFCLIWLAYLEQFLMKMHCEPKSEKCNLDKTWFLIKNQNSYNFFRKSCKKGQKDGLHQALLKFDVRSCLFDVRS